MIHGKSIAVWCQRQHQSPTLVAHYQMSFGWLRKYVTLKFNLNCIQTPSAKSLSGKYGNHCSCRHNIGFPKTTSQHSDLEITSKELRRKWKCTAFFTLALYICYGDTKENLGHWNYSYFLTHAFIATYPTFQCMYLCIYVSIYLSIYLIGCYRSVQIWHWLLFHILNRLLCWYQKTKRQRSYLN